MNQTSSTKTPLCLPSLKMLGDYWTLRVVDELSSGEVLRFSELERRLDGVNTATLSKRLKDMQQDGLLIREEKSRADVHYKLSELGKKAIPVVAAVNQFSKAAKALTK